MNPSLPSGNALHDVIVPARHLLLDFDGPICHIFAGLPAEIVADRLRKLLAGHAVQPPDEVARSADPFDVFAYAATISPHLAAQVEAEMAGGWGARAGCEGLVDFAGDGQTT